MSFVELNFYSDTLQMKVDVNVVVPDCEPGKKTKVLWLYHGGYGDHNDWVHNTNVVRMAEERGIAVVMPGVHNSCFVNMVNGPAYGTYVGVELPTVLRSMFTVFSTERTDNYVCGFSNGGYGCIKIGLTYPETFGYIGAFAAGDQEDNEFHNSGDGWSGNRIAMFGTGEIKGTEYSLKHCARELLRSKRTLPVVYHACGEFDPWHDKNQLVRNFFEELEGNPFHYHYKEYTGLGHTNVFRETALNDFLNYHKIGTDSRLR